MKKIEELYAKKIFELQDDVIQIIEDNLNDLYHDKKLFLTSAGKIKVNALIMALIFEIIRTNNLNKPFEGATIGINIENIIKAHEPYFYKIAEFYINEASLNLNDTNLFKQFNDSNLDQYLYKNNKDLILIPEKAHRFPIFYDNHILAVTEFAIEITLWGESLNLWKKGEGKVKVPLKIPITLFIKTDLCELDEEELNYSISKIYNCLQDTKYLFFVSEFQSIIGKINDFIVNEINKDSEIKSLNKIEGEKLDMLSKGLNMMNQTNNPKSNKSCYVATMVYEDIEHPKVELLRQFRDRKLSKNLLGRKFIDFYYRNAPVWTEKLKNRNTINSVIRKILDFIIKFI